MALFFYASKSGRQNTRFIFRLKYTFNNGYNHFKPTIGCNRTRGMCWYYNRLASVYMAGNMVDVDFCLSVYYLHKRIVWNCFFQQSFACIKRHYTNNAGCFFQYRFGHNRVGDVLYNFHNDVGLRFCYFIVVHICSFCGNA